MEANYSLAKLKVFELMVSSVLYGTFDVLRDILIVKSYKNI